MQTSFKRSLPRRVTVVMAFFVGLSACGGDGDRAPTVNEAGQQGRFCDLVNQFGDAAVATGAASAPGRYDGPPEALSRLFEQMGATVDELRATAPSEIRGDVGAVIEGLRSLADGATDTRPVSLDQAGQRIEAFRQANCTAGTGQGDQ